MNRTQCEKELLSIISPAERKMLKMERRKFRLDYTLVYGSESIEMRKEKFEKLREMRDKIARSRLAKVVDLEGLFDVCSNPLLWSKIISDETCQRKNLPQDELKRLKIKGCYQKFYQETEYKYVFQPLDIVPQENRLRIVICPQCFKKTVSKIHRQRDWDILFKHFTHGGQKTEDMLPVYVDYKRTRKGRLMSEGSRVMPPVIGVVEDRSETEDDGETREPWDGQITMLEEDPDDESLTDEDFQIPSAQDPDVDYGLMLRLMR